MTALAHRFEFQAARPVLPANLVTPGRERPRSLVHRLSLAAAWLAVASSAVVFAEPAPTDVLMMGLVVLLAVVGLVRFGRLVIGFAAALLVVTAFGFVAAITAVEFAEAAKHTAISLYLCIAAVVLAAFVARRPAVHARLLLGAQFAGALLAASAAIVGYFDIVPGSGEMLTRFGRATGTFKDPNVLGPFLVPALVYALHQWLNRPLRQGPGYAAAFGLLSFALLLTFSRGAWAAAALAIVGYVYLAFVTSNRTADRLRIIGLGTAGLVALVPLLGIALESDAVGNLFAERASLTQSYDVGPEGRFGGQRKALDLIAENPLGIGAGEFPRQYHHEDVHNVYLSMLLNAGWVGGLTYLAVVAAVLVLGLRQSFVRNATQGLMLVAVTSLAAIALEGAIIDTDHWRHFYLLLAIVVGLAAAPPTRAPRKPAIVRDRRSILLRPVVVLAPARRGDRILRLRPGPAPVAGHRPIRYGVSTRPPRLVGRRRPKRPARLLGPARAAGVLPPV